MGKIPDLSDSRYGHHTLFRLIEDLTKDLKPLVRRQPEDFTIGYGVYIHSIKKDLMERGFREIIESIEGLVELCLLLGKPENHVQVKTKQRGKKVESRTIADMTNEMEGELTELPKYTAYAKVLQGQQVWKGKIKTNSVGEEKYNPLCFKDGDFRNTFTVPYKDLNYRNLTMFTRRDLCQKRIDIEEEIRKRQENWRPTVEEPEIPIEEPKKPEPPKKAKTKKEEPPPPWY